MLRYAAILVQNLKRSIFTSSGKGKNFPAENITISPVGEVEVLTEGQKTKLRVKLLGSTLFFGSLFMMGRLYLKKEEESCKQQLKELDAILELYQLLLVELEPDNHKQHMESKPDALEVDIHSKDTFPISTGVSSASSKSE